MALRWLSSADVAVPWYGGAGASTQKEADGSATLFTECRRTLRQYHTRREHGAWEGSHPHGIFGELGRWWRGPSPRLVVVLGHRLRRGVVVLFPVGFDTILLRVVLGDGEDLRPGHVTFDSPGLR